MDDETPDERLDEKKLLALLALGSRRRYGHFVRKVTQEGKVWGLFDEGWAVAADDDGKKVIPVWADAQTAQVSALGAWETYEPRSITLASFLDRWIAGMTTDGVRVAVFPTPMDRGEFVVPAELASDLREELKQPGK